MLSKLIKTDEECERALARIDELLCGETGTPESEELELLATLVELYEAKSHPIDPPDPIEAIQFRMEQSGLIQRDLVPYFGSRAKVSEILSGKRPITLKMARALHAGLGVPAEVLLREPRVRLPETSHLDPARFPWHEIVRRGWLPGFRGSAKEARARAAELAPDLLSALDRKDLTSTHSIRGAASIDLYALLAWTARISRSAMENPLDTPYRDSLDRTFMRRLVGLSCFDDGPRLARAFLNKHGIHLLVERHLPKARIDGAATVLRGSTPLIGMTLRHDRLDQFWFCLCHELAHLHLHVTDNGPSWFVDDLDLRDVTATEREADAWADEALTEGWRPDQRPYSAPEVRSIAATLKVHPAIVAGRIRRATKNFRALSQVAGGGLVRHQFPESSWHEPHGARDRQSIFDHMRTGPSAPSRPKAIETR